jgi:hypothetical protein
VTWNLASSNDSHPAHPGTGLVKFTWYLDGSSSAAGQAPFEITAALPPSTTTSTSTTSTTVI